MFLAMRKALESPQKVPLKNGFGGAHSNGVQQHVKISEPGPNDRPPTADDGPPQEGYALVISGDALLHALKNKYAKLFLEIGTACIVSR